MLNTRAIMLSVELALVLAGAAVLTACSGFAPISGDMPPATKDSEPLDVVNAFHDAMNNNNVEIALALFAEDALVTDSGKMSEGMEQIRGWVEYLHIPAALHLEMIDFQVSGENVFWSDLAHNPAGSGNSLDILKWKAVIQNGRIKSLVVGPLPMPDGK